MFNKRVYQSTLESKENNPVSHVLPAVEASPPQKARSLFDFITDSDFNLDEASSNCALFVYSGLLLKQEAYNIAKDQRIKIGMFSALLLTKKIPLQVVKELSQNILFAKKAKDLFLALSEEQVAAFAMHPSVLRCVQYIEFSDVSETKLGNLSTLAIDELLSLSDKLWIEVLNAATMRMILQSSFVRPQPNVSPANTNGSFAMFFCCTNSFFSSPARPQGKEARTITLKPAENNGTSESLTM